MKRDFAKIYSFLNTISHYGGEFSIVESKTESQPEYKYNMELAANAGFVREVTSPDTPAGQRTFKITWAGHRFIDAVEGIDEARKVNDPADRTNKLLELILVSLL